MADLFAGGQIVDLILLLIGLEAVGLAWLARRRQGGGASVPGLLANLLAGAALLLALRSALTDAEWQATALWLGLAFIAHVFDLWLRLRSVR